jgi:group I intron endonuclease
MKWSALLGKSGVYEIRHIDSGKRYVGSSCDVGQRWYAHRSKLRYSAHHSIRLQRSWSKYGESCFEFKLLLLCAPEDLALYEQIAIDAYDAYRRGFNSAPHAYRSIGRRHTEETKQLLSKLGRGKKKSEAHRAALSAARMGKPLPAHVVEKIRQANIGKVNGPPSAEHRAAISAALKGRPKTEAHVEAMRAIRHSDETKMKISVAKAGKRLSKPRDPEHTRKQQEAAARTRAAKRAIESV